MNADLPPSGVEIVAASSGSTGIDWGVSSSKLVGECGIEESGLSSSRFRASSSSIGGFRGGDDGTRSPQFRMLVCIWVSVLHAGHGYQRWSCTAHCRETGGNVEGLGGCRALNAAVQLVDDPTGEFTFWRWKNSIASVGLDSRSSRSPGCPHTRVSST